MEKRALAFGVMLWSVFIVVYGITQEPSRNQVVDTAKAAFGQIITAPEKMFLTSEQRAQRIAELRSAVRDSTIKLSLDEVKEAFFEYLLLQCSQLFQGLVDALSEAVIKIGGDSKVSEAIQRLPGAFADGVYLTFHLIKTMANKQYLEDLKSLRVPLNCLLKKTARTTSDCSVFKEIQQKDGTTKSDIIQYNTLNKALFGVFEYAPKVLLPIAQVTALGITVGDRKVKGLVPLGIDVVIPSSNASKNIETVNQILNLMLIFSEELKNMEQNLGLSPSSSSSYQAPASNLAAAALPGSQEADAPPISAAEEAMYKKLAQSNAQASQIFKDMQIFAAMSHEITKLFPNDRAIGGVVIPLREMAQVAIACLYNITELGFGIIKIIDEKAKPMSIMSSCLKYTNAELKAAAAEGKLVDTYITHCGQVGCRNKKECIAKMLLMVVDCVKLIFDNVLVKYDPKTQTSQRGLLMNIDIILEKSTKILLALPAVKEGLNKINSKGASQAEDFVKKINSLRTLIKYFAQSLDGVMQGFVFAIAQIDFDVLPKEILDEYPEIKDEGLWNFDIPDDQLDRLYGELDYKEGV